MADENEQGGVPAPSATKASPKPPKVEEVSLEQRVAKVVEDWKAAKLRNTAFSRNTGAWNALTSALPDLIAKIVEEVS